LVGAMSFLVLVQGYELVARLAVGFGAKLGVALLVAVAAASLAYTTEDYLADTDVGE
jgi:hypothetical protein